MDYAKRLDFDPHVGMADERAAIVEAFQGRDHAGVIDRSVAWLQKHPVDAEIHILRAIALANTGNHEESINHKAQYYGLLASLLASGDGRSPESAIKVITVDEEYWLIRAFGGTRTRQSLSTVDGIPYDILDYEVDGEMRTLFFDISIPMLATSKRLQQ